MDGRTRLLTAAMKFMEDHGLVVFASTVAGGVTLGPEGALVGGLLAGVGAGVGSLITSPWWRRFAGLLISNLQIIYPFVRDRMHVVNDILESIAQLLIRLLRRSGLLENSRVNDHQLAGHQDQPGPTC